jgi:lipid II:glycine glycyltransferase (peptidoglycan interpeptide bridge formation enzyme)
MMDSFKSKLRSQIKKAYRSGFTVKKGWTELVDDFYSVFLENMRDLGSPVHSKRLIENTVKQFDKKVILFVIYKGEKPVAGSIVIGHRKCLHNPWASSIRSYSKHSPNMMLYWEILKYACQNGYETFDFGRSTPGEGTFRFKEQWGAIPEQLYWYTYTNKKMLKKQNKSDKSRFEVLIRYWQKLPVHVSAFAGPMLRKYISL